MRFLLLALLMSACHSYEPALPMAHGFEDGFSEWKTLGDASIQTAGVGLVPTEGRNMAFLSTMGGRDLDKPYSGIQSPRADKAREFLGLPSDGLTFLGQMPPGIQPAPLTDGPVVGESAAIKLRFYISHPSVVTFDWNRIGADGDSAYFTVWAEGDNGFRNSGWLVNRETEQTIFVPSRVDLCARFVTPAGASRCSNPTMPGIAELLNAETGWKTRSIAIGTPGWYWLGFGLGEIAESTVPTVLAIDNVRIEARLANDSRLAGQ